MLFGSRESNIVAARYLGVMRRSFIKCSKLLEYTATPPTKQTSAWTSLAKKLQGTHLSAGPEQKHVDKVKGTGVYSIEDSLGKLEEELQEEMASALGKTGDKLEYTYKLMKKAEVKLNESVSNNEELEKRRAAVDLFNAVRDEVEIQRRNLIIHRQAVGFYWRNHQIVTDHYPIPPPAHVSEK